MANVRDYGAIGDGVTDDTAALQHAIDVGDGLLEFNKGTYRISRSLLLDTTRQGFGAVRGAGGTTRLEMHGPGPAIRVVGDHRGTATPTTFRPSTWADERFPTLTEFEVLGAHPEADGIELIKTMQCTISRVLVRKCRDGIRLTQRNRNFVLSDSHLYDNARYGLFFDQCNLHQIIVHGNHISYNKRAGIKSFDGDVHNLQITGNDIEYNNRPGVDQPDEGGAEIDFETPKGVISEVTISSNTIQATIQPGGANIRIHGPMAAASSGARLVTICGNVLGSQTRGIQLEDARRVAISGNTIYDSEELSIDARRCSGVSVSGNTFVWRGGDQLPPRDGLRFMDCDNVSVVGAVTERLCFGNAESGAGVTLVRCRDSAVMNCQIIDPLVRGIELQDCLRCQISGNSIVDRRQRPSMQQAIRVLGKSRQNLIQNNMISGVVDKPIVVVAQGAMEQNNVVWDG